MRSEIMKPIVIGLSLLLMVVYINMNSYKLGAAFNYWGDINAGAAAPNVQIMLGDEMVYQQRLKSSELFDAAGQRQLSFIRLPKGDLARIKAQMDVVKLTLGGQAVVLSGTSDRSRLFIRTADKIIYLLAGDELKPMMLAIWNEQSKGLNTFPQCLSAGLCETLRIRSQDWGALDGPYLDTELRSDRRSMPRGRWSLGPKTTLNIQSERQQTVLMLINLLGVVPDQKLAFNGAGVTKAKRIKRDSTPLDAGGRTFYPKAFIVQMDLQSGDNMLEIAYSKWSQSTSKGALPVAAYMTSIKLKLIDE